MNENSCCSLSSPPLGGVLDFGHSNRCVVVSHWFFNRQFPSDTWCWACFHMLKNSSAQSFCYVQLFATPWTATCQASLSITNSRACSNSCPSSQWCHPTISSSVILFSYWFQSFQASGSFQMSPLKSGGQSIGVSASASVLPMNIQDWFPLGLTSLISL